MRDICYIYLTGIFVNLRNIYAMPNKKFCLFLLICCVLNHVFAVSIDELKQQKIEVQMHLQTLKRDLSHKGVVLHSLSKEVAIATKKANLLEKEINVLEKQKVKSNKTLHILQGNIVDNKNRIVVLSQQITEEIKALAYSELENQSICDSAHDQEQIALYQHYCKVLIAKDYDEYKQLQDKLKTLQVQNNNLQKRVIVLKQQEQIKQGQDKLILQEKEKNQESLESIKQSMHDIANNIAIYNKKQRMLNNKLNELLAGNRMNTHGQHKTVNARNIYEEPSANMVFLKPVNATVITSFGAKLPEGGRSKGILYDAVLNTDVKAVAEGVVLYSGRLTGFGEVVVIAHKDHYLSVYSGILSNVNKNQEVTSGQRIGSSGDKADQPMGGLYFELRHLGVPVKPGW